MLDLLPDYPALFWPAAAMAVVFIGVAKAGFGGGAGPVPLEATLGPSVPLVPPEAPLGLSGWLKQLFQECSTLASTGGAGQN